MTTKTHMSTWQSKTGLRLAAYWWEKDQVVQTTTYRGGFDECDFACWQGPMGAWLDRLEAMIADGWWQIA